MSTRALVASSCVLGVALLALGTTRDAWWTVVGGVAALATAAWIATRPPPPRSSRPGPEP